MFKYFRDNKILSTALIISFLLSFSLSTFFIQPEKARAQGALGELLTDEDVDYIASYGSGGGVDVGQIDIVPLLNVGRSLLGAAGGGDSKLAGIIDSISQGLIVFDYCTDDGDGGLVSRGVTGGINAALTEISKIDLGSVGKTIKDFGEGLVDFLPDLGNFSGPIGSIAGGIIGYKMGSDKSVDWDAGILLVPNRENILKDLNCDIIPARGEME